VTCDKDLQCVNLIPALYHDVLQSDSELQSDRYCPADDANGGNEMPEFDPPVVVSTPTFIDWAHMMRITTDAAQTPQPLVKKISRLLFPSTIDTVDLAAHDENNHGQQDAVLFHTSRVPVLLLHDAYAAVHDVFDLRRACWRGLFLQAG